MADVLHHDLTVDPDSLAETVEVGWPDGRVDTVPVPLLWDEIPEPELAPLGEAASRGSFASEAMAGGYVGARLLRRSADVWLWVAGDEDRDYGVIRTTGPLAAYRAWVDVTEPYLIYTDWSARLAAELSGLVDAWPSESGGLIDAAVFAPFPASADEAFTPTGVDISTWVDPGIIPVDPVREAALADAPWIAAVAAGDPAAVRVWQHRKAAWYAAFGQAPPQ